MTHTVLITGGAGFIGSHTVDLLLQKKYKIKILDNFSTGTLNNLPVNNSNLEIITGDICDLNACIKAAQNCNYIIHLAAQVSVVKSIKDPYQSFKTNMLGFINILETMRNNHHINKIIFPSSAAIYGNNQNLPLLENDISDNQLSPYALEKLNAERYLKLYAKLYNIKYTILRYFNIYGTRQNPLSPYSGVISKLIYCYDKNQPFTIHGDGNQTRDFINVKDAVYANLLALTKGDNQTYNIATGKESSILDLLAIFQQQSTKNNINVEYREQRPGDIKHSLASINKAKSELGFTCQYGISSIKELSGTINIG